MLTGEFGGQASALCCTLACCDFGGDNVEVWLTTMLEKTIEFRVFLYNIATHDTSASSCRYEIGTLSNGICETALHSTSSVISQVAVYA